MLIKANMKSVFVIGIPCKEYNALAKQSILSAIRCSYDSDQIIIKICVACSTPSRDLDEFSSHLIDEGLNYEIYYIPPKGIYPAFNFFVQAIDYDYLMILGADDLIVDSKYLIDIAHKIASNKTDIFHSSLLKGDNLDGARLVTSRYGLIWNLDACRFCHPGLIGSRRLYNLVGAYA